jgi:ABC-type sulfate/molybdate transport systems ATPase subunit
VDRDRRRGDQPDQLSALAGLIPVASGRVELDGQVIDDARTGVFAEAAARPVGFVFQDYRLFPHLSVADNVAFAPRARGAGRRAGPCLLVTHDALEALVLAERLLVLEAGRIVQEGTPAQVARQPATQYVAKLVGLNLYAGHGDGAGVRLDGGGSFIVAGQAGPGEVFVAVRPSSVVVSARRPLQASARNSWPASITGLTLLADRVRLEASGQPPALVDVTPAAVADLSLRPGSRVWLTVKATDLEVYSRAEYPAG